MDEASRVLRPGGAGLVVCNATFPHLPDKPRALAEMARMLKPGGYLVISHATGREVVNRRHREVGGVVAHDELPDASEMRLLLAGAGLEDVWVDDETDHYLATARRR